MNLILQSAQFAQRAHARQQRKFNLRPYAIHPARVAGRVAIHPDATEVMVAAAFLHDVVEDTPHTLAEIEAQFGPGVAELVAQLTNPSKGSTASRSDRKSLDREHLAHVSRAAKIIKLLDRIDNLDELAGASRAFVETYCDESRQLAAVIGDADPALQTELLSCIERRLAALSPQTDKRGDE